MSTGSVASADLQLKLDEFNPFLAMAKRFDIAADHLKLEPGVREILRTPDRELTVAIPVQMDDGTMHVFTGLEIRKVPPARARLLRAVSG